MRSMSYYIDDMGYLWRGPEAPNSTMHYARFEGIGDKCTDYYQIWVLRRSAIPEHSDEISEEFARRIIERYRQEAEETCGS